MQYTRVVWKVSDIAYNQCETQDKRPLGRDTDRSWCHLHTSVKLFWSQPIALWTSVAAYESVLGYVRNFSPCWYVASDAHGAMGCSQKNFVILIVWRWHKLLSDSLPNGCLSQFSRRLGQKLFRPPSYFSDWAHL